MTQVQPGPGDEQPHCSAREYKGHRHAKLKAFADNLMSCVTVLEAERQGPSKAAASQAAQSPAVGEGSEEVDDIFKQPGPSRARSCQSRAGENVDRDLHFAGCFPLLLPWPFLRPIVAFYTFCVETQTGTLARPLN